jgi:hypothetical protein
MAKPLALPPSARSLSASLRDLGYSLETAVADIIDNSISAQATSIDIICDMSFEAPVLAILDNGTGMDEKELLAAMKHGTSGPEVERLRTDLGRFGLGLKTASFSQCRQLTAVSARDGQLCGAEWDLDVVKNEDDWLISVLDNADIDNIPFIERLGTDGTLILWRKIDRFFEEEQKNKRDEMISESLAILANHISLVFHRFIDGEFQGRDKISISVNGDTIESFDPFCKKSGSQWIIENEKIVLSGENMLINAYILPHFSRLSAKDEAYYKNRSDFLSNQGVYVYRNGRLMAWGDWFRLMPKGESTKLARVQIDFPSALDNIWTIDIKKSSARPPHLVRERLKQILPEISEGSKRIYKKRGQKLFSDIKAPIWDRFEARNGIHYAINRDHALVKALSNKLSDDENRSLGILLDSIASALPIPSIYDDYATKPRLVETEDASVEEILTKLRNLYSVLFECNAPDKEIFLDVIQSLQRIFGTKMAIVEKFVWEEMP